MAGYRKTLTCLAVGLLVLGCGGHLNEEAAPVEMVATVAQDIQVLDIGDADCGTLGTVNLRTIIKGNPSSTQFLDVRLQRMRVSYQRTDGGTQVPAGFTQTISGLLPAGGSSVLNDFFVFEVNALSQAPFAALYPQNGGHDPVTGQPYVKMDVILEIFGETIAGDNVATSTRFPLTFCVGCGGCR